MSEGKKAMEERCTAPKKYTVRGKKSLQVKSVSRGVFNGRINDRKTTWDL